MGSVRPWIDRLLGRHPRPASDRAPDGDPVVAAPASNLEQALPTLAAVIRTWGEHCFDVDRVPAATLRARFGGWADHVEEGAPSPERPGAVRSRLQRDWNGLKSFVAAHRREERSFVTESAKELRETLWTFIERLSRGFVADRGSDARIEGQLKKLRSAIDAPSVTEMKREVLGAVDEIRRLAEERAARSRRDLEASIAELTTLREELNKARRELAIDPLTALYNRGTFDEQLRDTAALHPLSGTPSTLLMIDIDHFKHVNDCHGHPVGDEVLKHLADCVVRTLPRKTDFIARYGGEEFAVIFQHDGARVARALAERLLRAVRDMTIQAGAGEIRITISIGLAEIEEGEGATEWLARADQALYEAKRAGRDRVVESSLSGAVAPSR